MYCSKNNLFCICSLHLHGPPSHPYEDPHRAQNTLSHKC